MGLPGSGRSGGLRRRHFTLTRDKLAFVSVTSFRGTEIRWGAKSIGLKPESSLERQEGDDPRNFRLATPLAHDAPRADAAFRLVQFCAADTPTMDSWLLALRQNISMLRRTAESNRGHLHAADWNDTVHTGRGIPGRGSLAWMKPGVDGGGGGGGGGSARDRASTSDGMGAERARRLSVLGAPPAGAAGATGFSLTPAAPEGGYGWGATAEDGVAGQARSMSAADASSSSSSGAAGPVVAQARRASIATRSDDDDDDDEGGDEGGEGGGDDDDGGSRKFTQRMNVPADAVPGASMFDIATWVTTPPYLSRLAKGTDELEHPALVIPIWCQPGQEVKVVWVAGEKTCSIIED